MPPPSRPSPHPIQHQHGHNGPYSHSGTHNYSHGPSPHSTGEDSANSVSSSLVGGFDSVGDGFPVLDLVGSNPTPPSLLQQIPSSGVAHGATAGTGGSGGGGFELGSSGPVVLEPQQADFGFGLWPPDPWEALLQDAMAPTFWNESAVAQETSFDFASILQPQESAERGGGDGGSGNGGLGSGGGTAGGNDMPDIGDLLLGRISSSYPVSL